MHIIVTTFSHGPMVASKDDASRPHFRGPACTPHLFRDMDEVRTFITGIRIHLSGNPPILQNIRCWDLDENAEVPLTDTTANATVRIKGDIPVPFLREKDACVEVQLTVALDMDTSEVTPANLATVLLGLVQARLGDLMTDPRLAGETIDHLRVWEVTDL